MLEYNVRSALIARQIDRLAAHFDLHVQTLVEYRSVTLFVAHGCLHVSVPELRVNVAVSTEILAVIDAARIRVVEAERRLDRAAQAPPQPAPSQCDAGAGGVRAPPARVPGYLGD